MLGGTDQILMINDNFYSFSNGDSKDVMFVVKVALEGRTSVSLWEHEFHLCGNVLC